MSPEKREHRDVGGLELPLPGFTEGGAGPSWVRKRDGRLESFHPDKLTRSLLLAMAAEGPAPSLAEAQGFSRAVRLHIAASGMETVASERLAEVCREVLTRMGRSVAARLYWTETERKRRQARLGRAVGEPGEHSSAGGMIRREAGEWESWWIREAGLEPETARRLAEHLSQDLMKPGEAPTGFSEGFIREWSACLLTRWGLAEQAARLRTIGLPVRQVAELIRGEGVTGDVFSPAGTDRLLAAAVKETFMLEEVLSSQAAAAHRSGTWHIHGLGRAEGYYRLTARVEQIVRHGFRALPGRAFGSPPRYGHTLLSQWVGWQNLLEPLSVESVCWPDAAEAADRFMEEREESGYGELALIAAYEFAYRQVVPGERGMSFPPRVMLARSGREGVRFSAALLERLAEGDDEGLVLPGLAVSMDWDAGDAGQADAACRLAAGGGDITFRICPSPESRLGMGKLLPAERPACQTRITINLPRLAVLGGSRTEALASLDRLALDAAAVGECRGVFLNGLLERGRNSTQGIFWDRDRCPVRLDPLEAGVELAVDGLWDAARLLTESGAGAAETFTAAVSILQRLRESAREATRRTGIPVRTAVNEDPAVSVRFFELDEAMFPLALAAAAERGGTVNGAAYHTGAVFPRGIVDEDILWQWTEQLQELVDVPSPAELPLDLLEDARQLRRFLERRAENTATSLMIRACWKK